MLHLHPVLEVSNLCLLLLTYIHHYFIVTQFYSEAYMGSGLCLYILNHSAQLCINKKYTITTITNTDYSLDFKFTLKNRHKKLRGSRPPSGEPIKTNAPLGKH